MPYITLFQFLPTLSLPLLLLLLLLLLLPSSFFLLPYFFIIIINKRVGAGSGHQGVVGTGGGQAQGPGGRLDGRGGGAGTARHKLLVRPRRVARLQANVERGCELRERRHLGHQARLGRQVLVDGDNLRVRQQLVVLGHVARHGGQRVPRRAQHQRRLHHGP